MTEFYYALRSLKQGHWFKLICGASFQHLPAVRNLTLAYTLAGADCIDVAADRAVIAAAQDAIAVASDFLVEAKRRGFGEREQRPYLMVSLNDGEDPHFRKAQFDQTQCPTDCHRPCEKICPAGAIVFQRPSDSFSGVVSESCYGCGRCLPLCPSQLIDTRAYVSTPSAIAPLVLSAGVDAVEIHTQVGRLTQFKRLWQAIAPGVDRLKLVAISCPDGESLIDYLWSLYNLISPLPCPLLWQTDGRPMSGDIGDGTTLAAVKLGQKVLSAGLPGYVQLAGGTNSYTVAKLQAMGLLNNSRLPIVDFELQDRSNHPKSYVAGAAYGSYARVLLSPILNQLEQVEVNNANSSLVTSIRLEEQPELLWQAVELAYSLVSQLKSLQQPSKAL